MSFGKDAQGADGAPARPTGGARHRRRQRRTVLRRRRSVGAALVAAAAVVALLYGAPGASAADDEPDLLPFWGAFAVGCTWDNGCGGGHHGTSTPAVDFPMPEGTPIVAAGTGTARLYEDDCAGKYIEVWHSGVRKYSRYLHLSSYAATDGSTVSRGQIIGYSGNTGAAGGCSTGAHLHYDELDASHRRTDPGRMVGWSGGAWTTYPDALGASTWNAVPAFSGPALRNDYTITAGTPTTLRSTTTTPTPNPPPTAAPPTGTTAPAPPPPVTTSPRRGVLAEGTLFRATDAPIVYLYAADSPWWVPDANQLELLGGWGRVQVAGASLDALLSAMPWRPLQHQAFTEADSAQMYWCAGGSPWPVDSMEELHQLNALAGRTGWSRLPGGARVSQWACGGTSSAGVFQRRGASDYWVWDGSSWSRYADAGALAAAGYRGWPLNVIPA